MPLAAGKQDVIDAVGIAVGSSKDLSEAAAGEFHAGEKWSKVVTAFFKNGSNPKWVDFDAAESAFKATAGKAMTGSSFIAGWKAYAAKSTAQTPGAPPPGTVTALPDITPPAAPLTFATVMSIGSQSSHVPAAKKLFTEALAWATSGKIKVQHPGSPPPSPTPIPWI